ncbi:Glycosyltransferase, catalytic subunit of cellulose synthase and poly-beta-1,6-N-acetylglucosamine synthase [Nocardioides sp. YR527]|uniref:glycosyltransferase n=1 Tax=Nocardioides sp. YR527 TaxID=1881028 RepID=UPI00088E97C7|nr:glycosyltransferase [Nocardioides sp. YR527]SDK82606.1 Glycosyltransferase, catalytic subunit of cellulose synthase and poly-beta-1,6-N-acetylglucosamine synthase [Nocardioides sp. YR527]
MLDALPPLLTVAAVLLVPATVLLFTIRTPRTGSLAAATAIQVAILTAVVALGIGLLLGQDIVRAVIGGLVLGASLLAWLPAARDWDVRGLVAWALTIDVGLLYLTYVGLWTVTTHPGVWTTTLSSVLWLLEVFVFLIGVGYLWEMVDVLARRRWRGWPTRGEHHPGWGRPFVSLHVPTHNEPPEMVIETLQRMLELDYDAYEILVIDNNTDDPALWRPVQDFCEQYDGVTFIHLANWPGFKSGALNYALTRMNPLTEVVGIVDADYHVAPDFLAHNAPLFTDESVAFVQTPQDYRDWDVSPYFRRLYHSYGYFFDVSQVSRNERNGAIFGGTMGLIRASALVRSGGWDEWCITEDAELSLRLLKMGYNGMHVDRSYGRGVMPLTFETLKKQRFRWCFGGIQILRMHWRSLLPGQRTEDNQLTMAQRWAYLVGGLQWFGDLAGALFTFFLISGALDLMLGGGLVVRRLSGLLLFATVALVLFGAARSIALVRLRGGASWADALGAFGLWLALGVTVTRASWLGLVSREGTFLRTPKIKGQPRVRDVVRGNLVETFAAAACLLMAVLVGVTGGATGVAIAALLAFQGVGYALAPINSWAAIRSDLPADLRRRRERIWAWSAAAAAPAARRGGLVLAFTSVLLAGLVALAAPVGSPKVPEVGDVHGALEKKRQAEDEEASTERSPAPETSVDPTQAPESTPSQTGATASTQPTEAADPTPSTDPTRGADPTQAASGQPGSAGRPTDKPSNGGGPKKTQ